jgi:hypothetical protein
MLEDLGRPRLYGFFSPLTPLQDNKILESTFHLTFEKTPKSNSGWAFPSLESFHRSLSLNHPPFSFFDAAEGSLLVCRGRGRGEEEGEGRKKEREERRRRRKKEKEEGGERRRVGRRRREGRRRGKKESGKKKEGRKEEREEGEKE